MSRKILSLSTRFWGIIVAILLLVGCPDLQRQEITSNHNDPAGAVDVKPRGARLLGFGVTEGSVGYKVAFGEAKAAGIQFVELPQQWDDIEPSAGHFVSPFLAMANKVYPAFDTAIVLSINPIDTSNLRVPKQFVGRPLDDPEVILEFNRFADFVFAGLPDAKIVAVSIGNEVDSWLGDDAEKWSQYSRFVAAVAKHIRAINADVPIGVKTTWAATVNAHRDEIATLNAISDAIMVTYYPLNDDFTVRLPNTIASELNQLVTIAGDKPVFLLETGYPSGSENQSSEQQQANFVEAIFSAWDQQFNSIKMINFIWLHDLSEKEVDAMTTYYAVKSPAFRSYLATLGLKTYDGKAKKAFVQAKKCAAVRGWK